MPSELRVDKVSSTTSPYDPVFSTTGGALSHRNMIINGAMQVYQRGSLGITQSNDGGLALDRFKFTMNSQVAQLTGTMSQHSMSSAELNTTGFAKALKFETTTPENNWDTDELAYIQQIIEAQNLQHLQYGTASAKSVTLSFWAKSSITGTFAVGLYKQDSTARNINKTITISDTNWNKYTLTFPGDTNSGATIANDNGAGIYVLWHLGAGSDYNDGANTSWENSSNAGWAGGHVQNGIVTTNGATFYLTGVQLELGTVATPFEHRSYGDELLRCQRYFQRIENTASGTEYFGIMQAYSSSAVYGIVKDYVTTMRAEPHTVTSGGTFGAYQATSAQGGSSTGISGLAATPVSWLSTGWTSFSGLSAGNAVVTYWHSNAYLTADAEL